MIRDNSPDETRVIKKTLRKKKLFLEIWYKKGLNISETCKSVGIHRSTYARWRKDDEIFDEACAELEESLVDFGESKLLECVRDKHFPAIKFYLCNKGKVRGWKDTTRVETAYSEPLKIEVEVLGRNGELTRKQEMRQIEEAEDEAASK